MKQTTIKEINEYKSKSIDPRKEPETVFEMYSVPAYSTGHPEYLSGEQIASNKVIVEKNDILLCKINPRINRVWVVQDESEKQNIASSEWIVIRTKKYNPEYLAWYFQSPKFKQLMVSEVTGIGGSLTRAQPKRVANYPVPNIEREKQDEIVKRLNLLHDSIQKRKEEIQLFDELIKARFVEIFGDPKENPNNFMVSKLKDVSLKKLSYGSGASSTQYNGTVRYIRITDIKEDGSLNNEIKSPETIEDKYYLNDGDILFARTGATVGKTYRYRKTDGKAIYAGYLIRMIPNIDKVLPDYVFYFTKTDYYKYFIKNTKRTVAQPNINSKEYGDLLICVPPLELQRQFVNFVNQVDKSKAAIQKSIDKTQMLFDSLMQEYFS